MTNETASFQYIVIDNFTLFDNDVAAGATDPIPTSFLIYFHMAMSGVWYAICLTGICTNILNLRTFSIMGLKDSVTVAFFCLSVSDFSLCFTSFIEMLGFSCDLVMRRHNLYFYLPPLIPDFYMFRLRKAFTTTSILITAFLALQRCLCVVMPFHVKGMFTRFRTLVYMAGILVFSLALSALYLSRYRVSPRFNTAFNKTQLDIYIISGSDPYLFLMEVFVGTALNFACQLLVMICLVVMGIMLRKSSQFRQSVTAQVTTRSKEKSGTDMSEDNKAGAGVESKEKTKETQALIQVSLVSIIFVVTNSPYLISGIVNVLIPEYGIYQAYHNLYQVIHNTIFTMDLINSSVNFVVYFKYNTKFRKCFPFKKMKRQRQC